MLWFPSVFLNIFLCFRVTDNSSKLVNNFQVYSYSFYKQLGGGWGLAVPHEFTIFTLCRK